MELEVIRILMVEDSPEPALEYDKYGLVIKGKNSNRWERNGTI